MTLRTRRMIISIAVLAFSLAFVITYTRFSPSLPDDNLPNTRENEAETQIVPVTSRTGSDTQLIIRRFWSDGQLGHEEIGLMPTELVGLTLSELKAAQPEWNIKSFSAEQVVIESSCAATLSGFVGIYREQIAVYDGIPGGCTRLRETLDIPIHELPSFQVAELQQGIPFHNSEELFTIIEGLVLP